MVINARIEWLFLRLCLSLSSPPRNKEWEERRKQNIEKMNEEMEKIAEYERNQRVSATGAPWRRGGAAGSGECSNTPTRNQLHMPAGRCVGAQPSAELPGRSPATQWAPRGA